MTDHCMEINYKNHSQNYKKKINLYIFVLSKVQNMNGSLWDGRFMRPNSKEMFHQPINGPGPKCKQSLASVSLLN